MKYAFSIAALAAAFFVASAAAAPEDAEALKVAKDLCTESVDASVYPDWAVKDGKTCENSFVDVCTVICNSDCGRRADYLCYEPSTDDEDSAAGDSQ